MDGRISVGVKCIALLATVALLAGTADTGNGLYLASRDQHRAQPAPEQRWRSAAGQGHVMGRSGNRTVPKTLRAKYPLRSARVAAPAAPSNTASVAASPKTSVAGFDQKTSRELPARRGTHQRVFSNADGTETTEFSSSPINYRRPDGGWAPINDRLVPTGPDPAASGWRNAANPVGVRLAPRADAAELARVSLDVGHAVGFGLVGAKGARGRVQGSTVTYPDALPSVDVRLGIQGGGVKETLVLASPDAPHTFTFPLSLTGLNAQVVDGQVVLSDGAGRRRATIPSGFMTDSAEGAVTSAGVTYRLVTANGRPALQVSLDEGWLTDPARKFPVMVDPSVSSDGADSSLVVHGGSSRSGSSELLVGRKDGEAAASYVKFTGLADRLRNHNIFGAQLSVVNFDAPSCRSRQVTVHPVTQTWSSGSSFSYPGPSVGSAIASKSFAHGYIALGQTRSKCPPGNGTLIDLGAGGRKVVQGWVNGGANNGLSLRASATDSLGWKRFTGSSTANPPRLYVTHSPYNAKYSIPNPVPNPPVLQNQSGRVKITVTNLGAETWTPSTYYLAYRAYNASTGKSVTQQRSANLTGNVARNAKVTLDAEIKPLPPGKYFLDFTMVRTGGIVFTDEQVPPARIVLEVTDIPPVLEELFPPNGYPAQTLTPQLWARALDIDAPPGSSLQYKFEICEADAAGNPVGCTTSAYQANPAWTVPAGRLVWSKRYLWRAFVKDATTEVPSPRSALLTDVPQPEVTSRLAGAPYASQEREFDPQTGNVSTVAVDAAPVTNGSPDLRLVRTYNSLDPRRTSLFGAGWTTQYDMKLTPDDDGSGNVVLAYPDGQEVRFGKNPDGTYAAPPGRITSLTVSGSTWTLKDKDKKTYSFAGPPSGRLVKISDAAGHSVNLTYNTTDGKLAKAQVSNSQTNTAGRALFFTWSGAHIATVKTDPVGGSALTWTYTYDGDLLKQVCAPGSVCTSYTYGPGSQYRSAVLDDRPESYWRLGEPAGATGAGSDVGVNLGKDRGEYKNNVTLEAPGAIAGSGDTAATFNGTSSYLDLPKGSVKKSRDATVEVWFKANPAGAGGPLVGYQDKAVGTASTIGVPLLYHGSDGLLRGQFWNGTIAPMVSTKRVNDGLWHHAVLSSMGAAQTMFLDGAQAATTSNSATVDTSKLTFNQIGAAYATSPASWTGWGSTSQRYYNGTIDDVAVYTHPLGSQAVAAHYKYGTTAADQLSTVTLPSGRVAAEATYDTGTGRVTEYTDRNGGAWKIGAPTTYGGDADLRRGVEVRDPSNRPYLYEYDALAGRMIRSGAPTGLVIRDEDKTDATPSPTPAPPTPTTICTTPDPGDPKFCTTIPGESGGPVFEGHNLDGMAIRSYSYDDRGFLNVVTNENGDTVTMTHDDRGNVTTRKTCRTATECHTEYFTYPAAGADPYDPRSYLRTEHRDGRSTGTTDNRYRTSYTYHPTGQLLTQTNPDGGTVRNTYSNGTEGASGGLTPSGLLLTTSDPRAAETRYSYFHNGDIAKITEPSGLVTSFTYDALGRVISRTETSDAYPSGLATTYTYDALNHVTSITEPASTDSVTGTRHQRKTTLTYDADGNVTATTVEDLLGGDAPRTTNYNYNDQGRVERVTDPEGNETNLGYDRFGNTTSMVDANGNRYEFGYTPRNMLAEVRLRDWDDDPDGTPDPAPGDALVLHSYAYDFAGRKARDIDPMGHRHEYAYYGDDLLKSVTIKDFHNPDGTKRDYVVQSNTYDGAGNLTREVSGNGQTVTDHTINPAGTLASTITDPGGLARRISFTYDTTGNITKVARSGSSSNVPWIVSTAPEEVSYTYDLAGNRTKEARTDGSQTLTTSTTYDQRGLPTSTTDPRGNVTGVDKQAYTTSFGNDELGRQITTTGPAIQAESNGNPAQPVNPTVRTGYDTFDEPTATKDELGNITRTGYDRLGQPITVTAPTYTPPGGTAITSVTHTSYDGLGNAVETIHPRGNATRYSYDRLNRMVKRDEPATDNDDRALWRYAYTRTGEVLSVTDPTGARVESTYDDLDRQATLTQVEREPQADNFTTRYAYDDAGNVTSTTSPTGASSLNTYNKVGELTESKDPSGPITKFGYDFTGRQVRVSDGLGRTSRTEYDAFGRLGTQSDVRTDNTTIRSQHRDYDESGNLTAFTDPLGHTTTYSYDAANHLTRQAEPVTDTEKITTSFGYDAAGNRTRYTDGRGNSTISTVNTVGLFESVIEPTTPAHPALSDRTWTATYDADANPVRLAAPGGVTRDRTFDAAGRLTKETGAGAQSATAERTRSYNEAGRLTKVSAPGGDNSYVYNDRGGLLSAGGPSGTATFSYDGDGNQTVRTDASGTSRFGYVKGRLASVTDGITGTTQSFDYDAAGLPKSIDYGGGRVRSFGYDELGRVSSDELKNGTGQTAASIGYQRDLDDNLTRKTTTGTAGAGGNTYAYDQADRLTSWTNGTATTTYGWDASGNRTKAGSKTATYDARNRLQSDGDSTYTYTPRGTLASKTSSGSTEAFSFDAFDRLITEGSHTYGYDGLDRVASRDGTDFDYAGLEADPVADGTASYARNPAGELLAVAQGQNKQLILADQHDDIVGGIDPTDTALTALKSSTAYDPFGQVTSKSGSGAGNAGYQGDWTDPSTAQVNMSARWYNPATGTFNSRDDWTLAPQPTTQANRYIYANGNPLGNIDPTGHDPCKKDDPGGGASWRDLSEGFCDDGDGDSTSVGHLIVNSPGRGGNGGGGHTGPSAAERAAAARAAALARARARTKAAKRRAERAAKHHRLPAPKAAGKPNYSGRNTPPVSSTPLLPAKRVGAFRDVVADHNKAVQAIYNKAVADAGQVVQDVSAAVQAGLENSPGGLGFGQGTTQGCLVGICAPGQNDRGFPVFPNPFQPLQDAAQDIADAIGNGLRNLWDRAWVNLVIIGAVGKAIGDSIANAVAGDDTDGGNQDAGWSVPDAASQKVPDSWGEGDPTQKDKKGKPGWRWEDPNDPGNGVRIDKGDPNSPQPSQRVDHVVVRSRGKVLGRDGQPISGAIKDDPVNSHIPLSDWLKWTTWNHP
jgi:RHS repeat-associated protein